MKKNIYILILILISTSYGYSQHFSFTARRSWGTAMNGWWYSKFSNSTTGLITRVIQTPNGEQETTLIPRRNNKVFNIFGVIPIIYKKGNNGPCNCKNKAGHKEISIQANLDWKRWCISSGLFYGQRFIEEYYYTDIPEMWQFREDNIINSIGIPFILKLGNMLDHQYMYGGMVFYKNINLTQIHYIGNEEFKRITTNTIEIKPFYTSFIFGANIEFFFAEISFATNKFFNKKYIDSYGINPYSNYKKLIFSFNYGISIPLDIRYWNGLINF